MQMIYKWVENTHCDAKRSHILDFHDENKHFDQQSNFFSGTNSSNTKNISRI
jgi:hypothetical protein